MVLDTGVQSQYRLKKKRFLMPPCSTFSIIRCKWSNPGERFSTLPNTLV